LTAENANLYNIDVKNTPEKLKKIVETIMVENPVITSYLLDQSLDNAALVVRLKEHYETIMRSERPDAWAYYTREHQSPESFFSLTWRDFAFIRIMDYLDHEGTVYTDQFLHGKKLTSRPLSNLRMAVSGLPHRANEDHLEDMLHLLRQLNGSARPEIPQRQKVLEWMDRHPSGLDRQVVAWRAQNKRRIVSLLVERLKKESKHSDPNIKSIYHIDRDADDETLRKQVLAWWRDDRFHLRYAIRSADELNLYLDQSLDANTLQIMKDAQAKGIPIFATPYFLSLIDVRKQNKTMRKADEVLRSYLFYSRDLITEFGSISAWEKEDVVEPGKPNAAGWIVPNHTIHRRYPEVAIFIPSTMGRACGGLCSYCQRMYDFQAGRFNFNLDKLKPKRSWLTELAESMEYFKNDPYLSDILITGGDALMSSVASLENILDAVLRMAEKKKEENAFRPVDQKYAEFRRVRLGTKIPIYLPQRIHRELCDMLASYKQKFNAAGITQCVIQTHFSSAMEITPDTVRAIKRLREAGWAITNQEVFTVSASRRGHTAKLRKVLGDLGILPYYTFSVKGYLENRELFASNARSIQEQIEEKSIGRIDPKYYSQLRTFIANAQDMPALVDHIRISDEIRFLSSDRNVLNLPGVGKSNTYRTIGITDDGRRILEFDFDHTRKHSPAIASMGSVVIIETKSIKRYLDQLEQMGEQRSEYESIWGYSAGQTELRSAVFESMIRA
jgi:lysine 2,3-aminomutase